MIGSISVQIAMDCEDFNCLFTTAQEWNRYADGTNGGFRQQVNGGRFRVGSKPGKWPSLDWKWLYAMDNYANAIIARAFLDACGWGCEVVSDQATGDWIVLSNYDWQNPTFAS